MQYAATDQSDGTNMGVSDSVITDIRHITPAQLRELGLPCVAYLRAGMLDGHVAYAIHAADGTPMAIVDDVDVAIELAEEHGMAFVALH